LTSSEISDRLPDSYVLLTTIVPIANLNAMKPDTTAVSGVMLPIAVMPVEGGSAIVAADLSVRCSSTPPRTCARFSPW
jgi:hypothetical protein